MRSGGQFSEEEAASMTDEQIIRNIETAVSFDVPAGDMQEIVKELIKRFNAAIKKKRRGTKK